MARTHEQHQGRNFRLVGARHTISDGHGGAITAATGLANPSADGHGTVVFFFHNNRFLGWDLSHEALSSSLKVAGSHFTVKCAVYAEADALCCPSRDPVAVRYRWSGGRIKQSRSVPRGAFGDDIRLSG